ncbi:MAG TPA: 5-(carboxyamino)imidazole ribonucleotide synthase [Sandaracinaceae bacterium LLY-WYZ-13_1]|nr:5-(carboxyamino)imidazole ribonucleotide synthase [Sandaracinaceae bacterium LLY-WYZ-13_1]
MRIGILGGGQLGRMLALAGHPLGHSFVVLTPDPQAPASVAADTIVAPYEDRAALEKLAERVDVVTYEFENVPHGAVEALQARGVPVRPDPKALVAASDRWNEKELFRELEIATTPYAAVDRADDMERAVRYTGLPAVLKTRRLGYDGKGQRVLRRSADVEGAFTGLGGVPQILEGFVDFRRELSIVAVRGLDGAAAFYPLVENRHEAGILRFTRAPAPEVEPAQQRRAEGYATALLEALDYVGVLALELFDDGVDLLANEIAPRVHNSGHWSIEGAETSQFENHLRAITGAPLGSTAPRGESAMVNLIGEAPDADALLRVPGAHLHLYGKSPRPGRKIGHVTVTADDPSTLDARVEAL